MLHSTRVNINTFIWLTQLARLVKLTHIKATSSVVKLSFCPGTVLAGPDYLPIDDIITDCIPVTLL